MTPDQCLTLHYNLFFEAGMVALIHGVLLLFTGMIYRL